MARKAATSSRPRMTELQGPNSQPCNPAASALTPRQAVANAHSVARAGLAELYGRSGLFRKKKGRMNPVRPSFTAMRDVRV